MCDERVRTGCMVRLVRGVSMVRGEPHERFCHYHPAGL